MTGKLSIIIPAYNAEKSIGRCIDSILDQDYHNDIEIIVINDGSKDSTQKIIDNYQASYPDLFIIIAKQNEGVSSARNVGLDQATGDWIWFCDSDDYICKNGLSFVLDHFVDSDIDVCSFSAISLDTIALKSFIEPKNISGDCFFEGRTVQKFLTGYPESVWSHIYRREAISNVRFRNVILSEDSLFNLEVYMKDLRIRCSNANIYRYTTSANQATKNRSYEDMRRAISGYECIFDIAKRYKTTKSSNLVVSKEIDKWIASKFTPFTSRVLSANLTPKEFNKVVMRLKHKGVIPICEVKKKHRIINMIFRYRFLYPILSFFHRKVFVPFILPNLSRN